MLLGAEHEERDHSDAGGGESAQQICARDGCEEDGSKLCSGCKQVGWCLSLRLAVAFWQDPTFDHPSPVSCTCTWVADYRMQTSRSAALHALPDTA
jgi:hypothetical protein